MFRTHREQARGTVQSDPVRSFTLSFAFIVKKASLKAEPRLYRTLRRYYGSREKERQSQTESNIGEIFPRRNNITQGKEAEEENADSSAKKKKKIGRIIAIG